MLNAVLQQSLRYTALFIPESCLQKSNFKDEEEVGNEWECFNVSLQCAQLASEASGWM